MLEHDFEVVLFSAPAVVPAAAAAGPPEIESQHRDPLAPDRLGGRVHDPVVQRAAEQRMRMADDGRPGMGVVRSAEDRALEQTFDAAGGTGEKEGLDARQGSVLPKSAASYHPSGAIRCARTSRANHPNGSIRAAPLPIAIGLLYSPGRIAVIGSESVVPLSSEEFRAALRHWASGVSIVTTRGPRGVQGITVASFCSLSLEPPLILICINRAARSHRTIAAQRRFGVSILRDDQQPVSDIAAGRVARGGGLSRLRTRTAITGAPILADALAWLDCSLVKALPGGDHTIFVGRVEAAGHADGSPLLWFMSGYRRLVAGSAKRAKAAGRRRGAGARRRTTRRRPARRR